MNSMNGDGCSTQCQKEPFFNCVGESRDAGRCDGRVCSFAIFLKLIMEPKNPLFQLWMDPKIRNFPGYISQFVLFFFLFTPDLSASAE